jgi:hypothetical protein
MTIKCMKIFCMKYFFLKDKNYVRCVSCLALIVVGWNAYPFASQFSGASFLSCGWDNKSISLKTKGEIILFFFNFELIKKIDHW